MGRAKDREAMDRWCILRTTGARTIPLARSLIEVGIEAWTPSRTLTTCRPRSKRKVMVEVSLAPTFVFTPACNLPHLMRARVAPASPHPSFSIFSYGGRIPLIVASEIDGLRMAEYQYRSAELAAAERARIAELRKSRPLFPVGSVVRTSRPAFEGLTGIVQGTQGGHTIVLFAGSKHPMKIESWQVMSDILGMS